VQPSETQPSETITVRKEDIEKALLEIKQTMVWWVCCGVTIMFLLLLKHNTCNQPLDGYIRNGE